MHKVCTYEGCTFSAIPKVLREHVEKVHLKTKDKSGPVLTQESEEELRAYIEERRANYPTDANIKRKLDRDNKRRDIGQLQPDSEKNKRLKRLKEVLKTQRKMGVAKIAGTEKISNVLTEDVVQGDGSKTKVAQDNHQSLVPYSSDSENENQEKCSEPKEALGKNKSSSSNALQKKGKKKGRATAGKEKPQQRPRKKEQSLVSKLLSNSIRKEKSHILQCFRFLVKTRFKMATSF